MKLEQALNNRNIVMMSFRQRLWENTPYNQETTLEEIVRDKFDFSTCEQMVTVLDTCTCCARHQSKRPRTLYNGEVWKLNKCPHGHGMKENDCPCWCRQFSRTIFRSIQGLL